MTGTVCSCGNWSGNHDPDCVVATTIDAIWTVSFSPDKAGTPPEWNRAIETILVDNAHRVAAALNGRPDLTALAVALAEYDRMRDAYMAQRDDVEVDRMVDLATEVLAAKIDLLAAARALVASTGTETDDAQ